MTRSMALGAGLALARFALIQQREGVVDAVHGVGLQLVAPFRMRAGRWHVANGARTLCNVPVRGDWITSDAEPVIARSGRFCAVCETALGERLAAARARRVGATPSPPSDSEPA
jgi:hypothetical protein